MQWGETNNWHVQYTNLIDRNTLSARLARPESEFFHPEVAAHHELEYVSMIWNLEQSVKCHAWYARWAGHISRFVCTLRPQSH